MQKEEVIQCKLKISHFQWLLCDYAFMHETTIAVCMQSISFVEPLRMQPEVIYVLWGMQILGTMCNKLTNSVIKRSKNWSKTSPVITYCRFKPYLDFHEFPFWENLIHQLQNPTQLCQVVSNFKLFWVSTDAKIAVVARIKSNTTDSQYNPSLNEPI